MGTKTDPTANFDLTSFIAGCTPETRFVEVCQDRRLNARVKVARDKYIAARRSQEEGLERPARGLSDISDADRLLQEYRDLYEQAKAAKWITIEVAALDASVRQSIVKTFMEERGLTETDMVEAVQSQADMAREADYVTMAHAIVSPRFLSAEQVGEFARAIGDAQWAQIIEAYADAVSTRTSLEDLDPDFLPESSAGEDTEG